MSLAIAPSRTDAQRMEALKRGNEVRQRRAQYKQDIKMLHAHGGSAPLIAAQLIEDPPDWATTWKVYEFLISIPSIGAVRRNRIARRHGISVGRTIGGLSARQRAVIAAALRSPDTTYTGRG